MKNLCLPTHFRQLWLRKPISSQICRAWLISNDSLTFRLQKHFPDFSVDLLCMHVARPLVGERERMGVRRRQPMLMREVHLLGDSKPVVFAHSVLPVHALRGAWLGLRVLGNKPLGASLFANPKVLRTALEFKKLTPQQPLYHLSVAHLSIKPPVVWARRSIFSVDRAKIMVTEVFLPQLTEIKSNEC